MQNVRFQYSARTVGTFIIFYTIFYYIWIWCWRHQERIKIIGGDFFSTVSPLISCILLFSTYKNGGLNQKKFWLYMGIGFFCNFIAEALFSYYDIALHQLDPFPSWADVFYILQIIFQFIAIGYVITKNKGKWKSTRIIFDIVVMMIIACTVSWHYIMQPIYNNTNLSALEMIILLFYPISDLGIFLGIWSLYILARGVLPRKTIYILISSFFINIILDSIYLFRESHGLYQSGELTDPVWSFTTLLLGFSSLFVLEGEPVQPMNPKKDAFQRSDKLIPLFSTLFLSIWLLIQVPQRDDWFISSVICFILLAFRQYLTIQDNHTLINLFVESEKKLHFTIQELQQINSLREKEAMTDYLTGLWNRRYIQQALSGLGTQAAQDGNIFSLALIDIDHFKNINDCYGHDTGDAILVKVAEILCQSVRKTDIIGRIGGEEFIVLFPYTDLDAATSISERIRLAIQETELQFLGHNIKTTVSIGLTYWKKGDEYSTLLRRVDECLYKAKHSGRNLVVTYS